MDLVISEKDGYIGIYIKGRMERQGDVMERGNRIIDDLAKIANGAVGSLSGLRQDIEAKSQAVIERILNRMDLVTREEFEAARAMIVSAREEQQKLSARLDALEAEIRKKAKGNGEKN